MLILGFMDTLSEYIMKAFYGIMLILDGIIYSLVSFLYKVFLVLAQARIFKIEIYTEIAERVQIILGVGMLFVLAYALLRAVVNPDDISDAKGVSVKGLVPNIIKTIVLIAIVPTLFTYAYKAQEIILTQNIIGRVVIGRPAAQSYNDADGNKVTISSSDIEENYIEYGGTSMAQLAFETFLYRNEGYDDSDTEVEAKVLKDMGFVQMAGTAVACTVGLTSFLTGNWIGGIIATGLCIGSFLSSTTEVPITLAQAQQFAGATGEFAIYMVFIDKINEGVIHYSWFLSTVTGILMCYILASFCIDLGLRAIKLGYYQLIAPIPIFANLLPKGKEIFGKWVKEVTNTFLGVFIRVFVIYIVIFMISLLPDVIGPRGAVWDSTLQAPSTSVRLFARLFMILGLLMFAKQAAKLISDMFGLSDGSLKLGIKDKITEANILKAPAMRAGAAIGGAAKAGANNWNAHKNSGGGTRVASTAAGLFSGGARGAKFGKDAKSWADMKGAADKGGKAAIEKRDERYTYQQEHGGGPLGAFAGHMNDMRDKIGHWAGTKSNLGDSAALKNLDKNGSIGQR